MDKIIDEMADREARRVETMRVLKYQTDAVIALEEISPIHRDLVRIAATRDYMWAFLYVFSLGRIYGVRQERARRAKRHGR